MLAQDPTGTSLVRSFSHYSWLANPKIESKVHPPPIQNIIFVQPHSTPSDLRKCSKEASGQIYPPPSCPHHTKCWAVLWIYNWGSSPLPTLSPKNHHRSVPQCPCKLPHQQRQCAGNTTTSIPAAFQTIQFSNKEFYSFISPAYGKLIFL